MIMDVEYIIPIVILTHMELFKREVTKLIMIIMCYIIVFLMYTFIMWLRKLKFP